MFEAVITLCLALEGAPCRDQLIPGYEAPTQAACAARLAATPPLVDADEGLIVRADPFCTAVGPALDVTEVAPGVFVHTGAVAEPDADNRGDVANLGFVIGAQSIAVIDTGTARWVGEALWRAIRQHSDLPVSHVILTHMHPDHVLGASAFDGTGAQVVGHGRLPRALADRQANYRESLSRSIGLESFLGTRAVLPDGLIEGEVTVDLGGRPLRLISHPTAHTATDLTVLDAKTGTMFAGDLVFDRHAPALDGSLRGWRALLVVLAETEVTQIVPGHGRAILDWPEGGEATARYLRVLEDDTRAAVTSGMRLGDATEVIGQSEAPHWEVFDAYNPRNATVAFTELEWE